MATNTASSRKARAGTADVTSVLDWLKAHAQQQVRDEMAPRYGIVVKKAFGVRMADMLKLAKTIGTDHELAARLWATEWYEARMVAAMIDDPASVTAAQMDAWCKDFDNWGIVDTVCFKLFDRTPHAFAKVKAWAKRKDEFQKRAGFALLACIALHDDEAQDNDLRACLPVIEAGANDERNFVKKGVSWALRAIGGKRPELRDEVVTLAQRLAASTDAAERWVGKDVLREITRTSAVKRLAPKKK
jgi:3-methyladenine DNA glycosylase AlkD